jgi:hypothetical protein
MTIRLITKKSYKTKSINRHKYKTSKNICKLSKNLLAKNTTKLEYNKYETYLQSIPQSFTSSKHVLPLLTQIFITKDNINFNIICKEQALDEYNKIPPFIEIFKYLISKDEFIKNFNINEQNQLNRLINKNKYTSRIISKNNSKNNYFYKFLSKSDLGKKLSSLYYSIDNSIKSELSITYPSLLFHSLLINSYTSFEIIEDLETNIKKLYTFSIEWKGKHIDNLLYLFMYKNDDSHKNNKTYIENIGNEIIKRILFFNEFLGIDNLPNKFIVFLTDNKKQIDDDVLSKMHFKTLNINSAVTNGKDIIIYRQEELLKSIFHELIHFHNLDFRNIPDKLLNYIMKTHNIKADNEYTLFECVTESLANMLNNVFLSRNINEFTTNMKYELMFSTVQIAKILSVCGYKNWDEFSALDNINKGIKHNEYYKHNIKTQFKQDSCVFSYYILKFYIMLNLEYYFKHCLDIKLKFIQTEKSFESLITLFDSSKNNEFLKDIMNSLLSNNNSLKNKKIYNTNSINNIINNTLRMTCLESNIF